MQIRPRKVKRPEYRETPGLTETSQEIVVYPLSKFSDSINFVVLFSSYCGQVSLLQNTAGGTVN